MKMPELWISMKHISINHVVKMDDMSQATNATMESRPHKTLRILRACIDSTMHSDSSIDLDIIAKHVKNLLEQTQCVVCGCNDGARVRCGCGGAACSWCLRPGTSCANCLTPSPSVLLDRALSARIEDAANLLNVFQSTFHTDVYERGKMTARLKAEKKVFPHCIQAPTKYYNRRKTLPQSAPIYPRLEVSYSEGSVARDDVREAPYSLGRVSEWLHQNDQEMGKLNVRRPFSELNANIESSQRRTRRQRLDGDDSPKRLKLNRCSMTPPSEVDVGDGRTRIAIRPQEACPASRTTMMVVAEIHAPPTARRHGAGGGGDDGGGAGGTSSSNSSDKENRDPAASSRRRRRNIIATHMDRSANRRMKRKCATYIS